MSDIQIIAVLQTLKGFQPFEVRVPLPSIQTAIQIYFKFVPSSKVDILFCVKNCTF